MVLYKGLWERRPIFTRFRRQKNYSTRLLILPATQAKKKCDLSFFSPTLSSVLCANAWHSHGPLRDTPWWLLADAFSTRHLRRLGTRQVNWDIELRLDVSLQKFKAFSSCELNKVRVGVRNLVTETARVCRQGQSLNASATPKFQYLNLRRVSLQARFSVITLKLLSFEAVRK